MRPELKARILAYNREIAKAKEIEALVSEAGGIKVTVMQSDKLGFNWKRTYVNDILVKSVYVAQENPAGTADNPIEWAAGMALIQNAYYTCDGVCKVWMGEAGAVAGWDDSGWEVWQ